MRFKQATVPEKDIHLRIGSGTDGLYSQDLFRDLLVHERKRSERSKRQMFFVALDIKDVLTSTRADAEVVGNIIKSISKSSREIDIKGWYEAPICIGIHPCSVKSCLTPGFGNLQVTVFTPDKDGK